MMSVLGNVRDVHWAASNICHFRSKSCLHYTIRPCHLHYLFLHNHETERSGNTKIAPVLFCLILPISPSTIPQSPEIHPVAMAVHCRVRNWRKAAASESWENSIKWDDTWMMHPTVRLTWKKRKYLVDKGKVSLVPKQQ